MLFGVIKSMAEDALKSYEEAEEIVGGIKVRTINRIIKYFLPNFIMTEIQPVLKVFESSGIYRIKFVNEGEGREVKTDVFYLNDSANPFSRTI